MVKIHRILLVVLAFIILIMACAVGSVNSLPTAKAVVIATNNFDNTEIEDDLADIDLDYVQKHYSNLSIIEFVEYCYSDNVFRQGNYGLYLYVYNPDKINFSISSEINTVNIATSYNSDGQPFEYNNKTLKILDRTEDNLFYKFKVIGAEDLLPTIKAYSKAYGKRRYDIVGIQIRETGKPLSVDYGVGGTWTYTGYAKGYGSDVNADSTLDCEVEELTTLTLDVHSTFYRPEGFNGANVQTQDQLNSVYFSVPDSILNDYGTISAIHADWYEYRTNPILVCGESDIYDSLKENLSKDLTSFSDYANSYTPSVKYGFAANYSDTTNNLGTVMSYKSDYTYNYSTVSSSIYSNNSVINNLHWLFYADNNDAGNYNVLSDELINYALEYSKGKTDLIQDKYSMSLFTNDVGTGRTAGYNNVNIPADSNYDIRDYSIGDSWWEKFFGIYDVNYSSVKAVEAVSSVPDKDDSDIYYVDSGDMDDFIAYVDNAENNNETTFLFRFAFTEYYSARVQFFDNTLSNFSGMNKKGSNGYMAIQNMFVDFDIIDITFCRDGVYTVIPVVADPIDIIGDVTPPPNYGNDNCNKLPTWLIVLIIVVCCIILLPVIIMLLPHIATFCIWLVKMVLKLIWFIISLPFRFVSWIVHKVRGDG